MAVFDQDEQSDEEYKISYYQHIHAHHGDKAHERHAEDRRQRHIAADDVDDHENEDARYCDLAAYKKAADGDGQQAGLAPEAIENGEIRPQHSAKA